MDSVEAPNSLGRLQEQHREYEAKLESLLQRPYLTEEEKLQQIRLKKLKLHVKDEMASLKGYSA